MLSLKMQNHKSQEYYQEMKAYSTSSKMTFAVDFEKIMLYDNETDSFHLFFHFLLEATVHFLSIWFSGTRLKRSMRFTEGCYRKWLIQFNIR